MSRTVLADQLGAMRLIDELRHRQLMVTDHLDLPVRRAEVAARIREYYLAQGVVVDDETVTWAVREHFDKRLTFEAPAYSGWSAKLALAYLNHRRWAIPAASAAVVLLMGGVAYALLT